MALGIGLMSGTSLDAFDAALVQIEHAGRGMVTAEVRAFVEMPLEPDLKQAILAASDPDRSRIDQLTRLNVWLGEKLAQAALAVMKAGKVSPADVMFIASHGQTIWHVPPRVGVDYPGTLQIGEPAVIAERTGVLVVSSLRARDMAAGGQGAPLVPYVDYLLYRSDEISQAFLNIGGIANITYMPKGGSASDVVAFDTGPGNMLIDSLVRRYNGEMYDKDGAIAQSAVVDETLLAELMAHPYFEIMPPKSTGREEFGDVYLNALLHKYDHVSLAVWIATATAFTVKSIATSMQKYLPTVNRLVVAGGGAYNPAIMAGLAAELRLPVISSAELGLEPRTKEAVAMAILGYQALLHRPGNLPAATGAKRFVVLGNITPSGGG